MNIADIWVLVVPVYDSKLLLVWVGTCRNQNRKISNKMGSRRKFRSQTSDSMDRWKSRGGKGQRREEKNREEQRKSDKERVKRKKMQVREKVGKSRFTLFFQ